jgi:hypothetical protein
MLNVIEQLLRSMQTALASAAHAVTAAAPSTVVAESAPLSLVPVSATPASPPVALVEELLEHAATPTAMTAPTTAISPHPTDLELRMIRLHVRKREGSS